MKARIKKLGALISMSLAQSNVVDASVFDIKMEPLDRNPLAPAKLNIQVSDVLAAHRSHASHSSHRSSSGSSGYSRPAPTPSSQPKKTYTPPPVVVPKSDPLGQDARPSSSYPSSSASGSLSDKLADKEKRQNIIMRMQLTLQFEGYYKGFVDGKMGPETRKAVLAYKKAHSIPGDAVLDADTLNALGIKGF